jgi:hypothetical protein
MDARIETLLGRFDFEKIHDAMIATNWVWTHDHGPQRVPTIDALKETARELAESCLRDGHGHSTGGFSVYKFNDGDYGGQVIELAFTMGCSSVPV